MYLPRSERLARLLAEIGDVDAVPCTCEVCRGVREEYVPPPREWRWLTDDATLADLADRF